jgi:hypothetical protein
MQDPESSSECCAGIKARCDEWCACAQKMVREEPLKAAGWAFVAGIFCAVFPVGRILGAVLRLAFALVRPVLLLLGFVKLFEEVDRRRD